MAQHSYYILLQKGADVQNMDGESDGLTQGLKQKWTYRPGHYGAGGTGKERDQTRPEFSLLNKMRAASRKKKSNLTPKEQTQRQTAVEAKDMHIQI